MLSTKSHHFYYILPGNPRSVFFPFSLIVERLIRAALEKKGSAPVELISFPGRICCDYWKSIWPLLLRSRRQRMEMSRFECELKRHSLPKINVHACVRWLWRQSTYWKSGAAAGAALKFARTPSVSSTWLRQWRRTSSFSCVCAAGANSISPLVRSFVRSLARSPAASERATCVRTAEKQLIDDSQQVCRRLPRCTPLLPNSPTSAKMYTHAWNSAMKISRCE